MLYSNITLFRVTADHIRPADSGASSASPNSVILPHSTPTQIALVNIKSYKLLHTMACFHVISTSMISGRDHPCAHYFLWILPLCALLLCSMTHYDITMDYDVVRDAPLWNNNG